MQVIDETTIKSRTGEAEALEAVDRAFRALAEGRVMQPPPMSLDVQPAGGEVHVKGACLAGSPVFAIKVASGFYGNQACDLPTGSGLVLVFDATTGFPLGVLQDNGYLTDLRTAAAGALAARLLTKENIRKVAFIGSGVQTRFQSRAIARVRQWTEAAVWSRNSINAQRCCEELTNELERLFVPAASVEEAVKDAQLVVTVTPSRTPLVESAWLAPGVTILAVGSDGPDKQELTPSVLGEADKVVADRLKQCLELGEIHHAVGAGVLRAEQVYAELGEILIGEKPGREGNERIVCDLTGVGAQDAAIAEIAWES
jgi:ornithine cyclodeaminase